MKRLDHRNATRNELVEYAGKLESALFEIHNLFWFEICEDGFVRPVARIPVGAEERLTAALSYGRDSINSACGRNVLSIRDKRKAMDRRIVAIMSMAMTLLLVSYVVCDVLSSFGIVIMNGEF